MTDFQNALLASDNAQDDGGDSFQFLAEDLMTGYTALLTLIAQIARAEQDPDDLATVEDLQETLEHLFKEFSKFGVLAATRGIKLAGGEDYAGADASNEAAYEAAADDLFN